MQELIKQGCMIKWGMAGLQNDDAVILKSL